MKLINKTSETNDSQDILTLKVEVTHLTSTQIRLLKNLHSLATNILSCEDEDDYFETSAALLKKAIEIIKYSEFTEEHKEYSCAEQAIEYAIDHISDLPWKNLNNYDN